MRHLAREPKNMAHRQGPAAAARPCREFAGRPKTPREWARKKQHSRRSGARRVNKGKKRLRRIIGRYRGGGSEKPRKFGNTLENAQGRAFAFLPYPGGPSTANPAGQSIRGLIARHSSRVQLKSDRGAGTTCALPACAETGKLRRQNVWEQPAGHLAHAQN